MADRAFFDRLRDMTPFGWWSARKPARGVTVLERQDDFNPLVLVDTPHIHIHYFTTDEHLEKKGWGYVHLVCHECQMARKVTFGNHDDADIPSDGLGLPAQRRERERFVREHGAHGGLYAAGGGRMLCPPNYSVTDEIDLRVDESPREEATSG